MNTVLNGVVVLSLDIHIWSGRKKLRPDDLAAPGKLPPKDLISLGSKKIFDPKALKPFCDLKREADSLCSSSGVRFARSYAVPRDKVADLAQQLNGLCARFNTARAAFLDTFDEVKSTWKAQHPGYERLIDTELLPKASIAQRLAFGYQVFAINTVDADDNLASLLESGGANNIANGLLGQLYLEVGTQARQFVKQSLVGRTSVTQKFLRPVRAMRDKLSGLAFLDPSVNPLIDAIDDVLAQLPAKGMISGLSLEALRGIVGVLCDPAGMRHHGQLVLSASGLPSSSIDDGESLDDANDQAVDIDTSGPHIHRTPDHPEPATHGSAVLW